MQDKFNRDINYMRISITDRCNLRCRYCMPRGIKTVSMSEILTYEEILEIVEAAALCGITKIKVTGGEPLARLGAVEFIKNLKRVAGIQQVTMTTNGVLLAPVVNDLAEAGLDGVNISLDTLNPEKFFEITGFDVLDKVLESIDAAVNAGLKVKINAVLQENLNQDDWEELLNIARDRPIDVRFIELMPLGEGRNFKAVSNAELLGLIRKKYPDIELDAKIHGNGPAVYFKIPEFKGAVGFISAVHDKFCSSCNRIRLTARGELKPCLCFADYIDLRRILREDKTDERHARLVAAINDAIKIKPEAHKFGNFNGVTEQRRMAEIGG